MIFGHFVTKSVTKCRTRTVQLRREIKGTKRGPKSIKLDVKGSPSASRTGTRRQGMGWWVLQRSGPSIDSLIYNVRGEGRVYNLVQILAHWLIVHDTFSWVRHYKLKYEWFISCIVGTVGLVAFGMIHSDEWGSIVLTDCSKWESVKFSWKYLKS